MVKMNKQELIKKSKKIVIKIGSNVLTRSDSKMDKAIIANISEQVISLMRLGKQVVIVSSGAQISGLSVLGCFARHSDITYKQASCAIGQVELIMEYKRNFQKQGIQVGQLLVTGNDFENPYSTLNIRNTLFTLIDEGVVPIINENDSVCIEEFSIGDNDNLAALTARLWNSDLLVLLSDVDGLFADNPLENNGNSSPQSPLPEIDLCSDVLSSINSSGKGLLGTGGMESKLAAAKRVSEIGIPMLLLNGKKANILIDILEGKEAGTVFWHS